MHSLRKQADDYRPTLTPLGALERDLLDRFDGTHSAAELESWLAIRSRIGAALSAGGGRVPQADDRALRLN